MNIFPFPIIYILLDNILKKTKIINYKFLFLGFLGYNLINIKLRDMARYQPIVIEKTTEILCILEESNFFKDYEIENFDFAIKYLNDKLTEKFILGELDEESDNLFGEEEFNVILREIVAGTILTELKQKGLVNSYEDDNTEELFFLTQKGKKMLKNDGDFNIR